MKKGKIRGKDIRRCYGLWKDCPDDVAIIRREALKARKAKWRRAPAVP